MFPPFFWPTITPGLPWPSSLSGWDTGPHCPSPMPASPRLLDISDSLQHVHQQEAQPTSGKALEPLEAPIKREPMPTEETVPDYSGYKTASRGLDGLFHCPWEGQTSCKHKPHKQKRAVR
jgi:hypothetical protein